jgi:hypothetical protein
MLTAAIAAPKISFDTGAMISFSAVARRGLQPISPAGAFAASRGRLIRMAPRVFSRQI